MIKVKVNVEIDDAALQGKIDKVIHDPGTMTEVHELFAKTVDPWTPFLTGRLHSDIMIDSTGVTYNVPYAAKKYYGVVYCKEHHPLATSYWDEVAMQTMMPEFEQKVKEILLREARRIYG